MDVALVHEATALTNAVARVAAWYDNRAQKGRDLWVFAGFEPGPASRVIDWRGWYDQTAPILGLLPDRGFDPLPNPNTLITKSLTYATAMRFDRAVEARTEFEAVKDKLRRVVHVVAALGIVTDVNESPPLLVIPRPPGFALERSADRLNELKKSYPGFQTEFTLSGLPDAILSDVRQAARANYEYLLAPAREAVKKRLAAGGAEEDTPARWAEVGAWLGRGPQELAAWRALALVLARLNDPKAADPVTAMAEFLAKASFPIEIRQITIEVPFRYADVKPQPAAAFSIYHPATVADGPALVLAPVSEPERDESRRIMTYTFRARERQRLTYRPGEALWATLPLREGQSLAWTQGHSNAYQFEHLLRPPRLHRTGEPSAEGMLLEGIQLALTPADGVPQVPDLMPTIWPAK
jgi:hypothetical protein